MPFASKRWVIPDPIPANIDLALSEYPPVMRQVLYNRGISSTQQAQRFLLAETPEHTDPFLMLGIPQAVDRLHFAIRNQEKIAIYGDYDADGVTATALLVQFLENLGAEVMGYIPSRFEEGYGLNNEALTGLHDQGVKVVVSVDCGIRSPDEADHARSLGIDLIISDHHQPAETIPNAFSVINPKQPGDPYLEKNLAGVGVAYKLAAGFIAAMRKAGDLVPNHLAAEDLLDLVALGTVSDLVPLLGENRSLVRLGIERIRQGRRQGILSLAGAAGLKTSNISSGDVSFMLGPRLNAAGRLDSALTAYYLLISKDVSEASNLAQKLEIQNKERQEITRKIQLQVEEKIAQQRTEPFLLFAADPGFNSGVVGLVASRLTESYYRPAIVAQQGSEFTRGSCRSIPEFHITEALDLCSDLLEHHGGHAAAAGFTVRNENLENLIEQMESIAQAKLANIDLRPTIRADIELPLSEVRADLLKYLNWLQPTGQSNPQAVFVSRDLRVVRSKTVGKENNHLKLTVTDGRITYDAIAFRMGELQNSLPPRLDLIFNFESNEYNGQEYLQLNVKDIHASMH